MNKSEAAIAKHAQKTPEQRKAHASMMGLARAKSLSPKRRKEISEKANAARWGKKRLAK